MTNGEVFQKIFPCEEIHINGLQDGIVHFSMTSNLKSMDCFSLEWWNAEYNGSFAVPEKGEWIYTPEKVLDDETDEGCIYIIKNRRTCSNCGGDYGFSKPDKESFCKFCGADMRGGKE